MSIKTVVADGGSHDDTRSVAFEMGAEVVTSRPGRGYQLRAGAACAVEMGARTIWLVHADTTVTWEAVSALLSVANMPEPQWGRFDVHLNDTSSMFRVIETMMNLRSALTGICTGDQAMFVHADLLTAVGGVPGQALMEDIEISKRLRRLRSALRIREQIGTSARRWQVNGVARTILHMWGYRLRYFMGTDPDILYRSYYG
jgi:rSAM/selenodomain-associated transferase 2